MEHRKEPLSNLEHKNMGKICYENRPFGQCAKSVFNYNTSVLLRSSISCISGLEYTQFNSHLALLFLLDQI